MQAQHQQKLLMSKPCVSSTLQDLRLLYDRAAHGWAVKAMTQEATLGVEILAYSAAPGNHTVQLQVQSHCTSLDNFFFHFLLHHFCVLLRNACNCTNLMALFVVGSGDHHSQKACMSSE